MTYVSPYLGVNGLVDVKLAKVFVIEFCTVVYAFRARTDGEFYPFENKSCYSVDLPSFIHATMSVFVIVLP